MDPGQHYMAWALFHHGELVAGSMAEANKGVAARATMPKGDRARQMTRQILSDVVAIIGQSAADSLHIVVEGQQTREGEGKKGDQQVFVEMAFNSGFIAGQLALRLDAEAVESITPTLWKGSLKKEIMLRRIDRILKETGEHKKMHRYNKDTKDAAGIGLWYLRRMK